MKRSSEPPLPTFRAESASRRPLYLQVAEFLREAIRRGHFVPGGKLPSSRTLARRLAISRNTVLTAYETLTAEGLIHGRTGSGTRVAGRIRRPKPLDLQFLLRNSHYPADPVALRDPDGHPLYIHR